MKQAISRAVWPLFALAVPLVATADATIRIERNSVVPVVMENSVSIRDSRRGDRFEARVENGYDLPSGTRFLGRVVDVQRKRNDRPAYLEVEFYEIELPDGTRSRVKAVPVSMERGAVKRGSNGRHRTTGKVVNRGPIVLGGAALGGILAAVVRRPVFDGILVGAVAGIIVAESERLGKEENVTIRRGTRLGAMFEDGAEIRYSGNWRRGDEGYSDQREPRYDDRDDPRDERWEDDRREEDRYDERYDDRSRITYRGRELRFGPNERPYRVGRTIMVPLRTIARQLDLDIRSDDDDRIRIEDEDSNLELEHGSRSYRLNGRRGSLEHEVTRRDGELYVPLAILAEMKRDPVTVDGSRVESRG